jgi:sulfatase maturation enzyme AslB (radical SAM superfamily)
MQRVRPFFETDSLCQSCYVLPGCQGGTCPLARIRDHTRSCCSIKSEIKTEMRVTLAEAARAKAQVAVAT